MILYDYLLDVRGIGKGSAATRPMSRREEARGVGRANARGEGRETFSPIKRFSEQSRRPVTRRLLPRVAGIRLQKAGRIFAIVTDDGARWRSLACPSLPLARE